MLKKPHRLAKTTHIQTVFARGRGFFNTYLTVKVLKKSDTHRFTVVVSTKVSKKAVVRNRIKRVLREVIRKNITSLMTGDYVIIVKPAATKILAKDLPGKLMELFVSSRILQQ